MLLASQEDVEARLGRDLTSDEVTRLDGLLEEVSALIEGYLGVVYAPEDDIPNVVAVVVSKVVARAIAQSVDLAPLAAAMEGVNTGPFGARFRDSNIFLTKAEKLMLRPVGGGLSVVTMKSERGYNELDTED